MRIATLLFLLATSLALAAQPVNQDATREDVARLQGIWLIESVEINGQPLAMDRLKGARLSIEGSRYSFQLEQTRLELTFKLDASKTPRAIDLEVMEGPEKGKVCHGIYRFDKGRYIICRPIEPGQARPTEFATRPDSGLIMVAWKQQLRPQSPPAEARP